MMMWYNQEMYLRVLSTAQQNLGYFCSSSWQFVEGTELSIIPSLAESAVHGSIKNCCQWWIRQYCLLFSGNHLIPNVAFQYEDALLIQPYASSKAFLPPLLPLQVDVWDRLHKEHVFLGFLRKAERDACLPFQLNLVEEPNEYGMLLSQWAWPWQDTGF